MSHLFIELYLDEDVDVNVAILVRGRGFFATTTHDVGRLQTADIDQLAYATEHGKALLTHNRNDFLELAQCYQLENKEHCGIFIARRRPPHEIVRRLVVVLNAVTADEFHNQVRFI